MATTQAPPPPSDTQLLIELGRLRAELEHYQQADIERERAAQLAAKAAVKPSAGPPIPVRWTRHSQGKVWIGDGVYQGYGPVRDRTTRRVIRQGQEMTIPSDHARVLVEADYCELVNPIADTDKIKWTPIVVVRPDAAPQPDPGDMEAWEAREVR